MPRLYARIPEKYDIDRVEYEGECPQPGQVRWLVQDGGSLVAYDCTPIVKHTWAYTTPEGCA